MNKRKKGIGPFRILAFVLAGVTTLLLVRFPSEAVSLQNRQEQLAEAMNDYYDAQSRNNQLSAEYREIGTKDFIERTARREYGYCWYGETVYEVSNLDELLQEAALNETNIADEE